MLRKTIGKAIALLCLSESVAIPLSIVQSRRESPREIDIQGGTDFSGPLNPKVDTSKINHRKAKRNEERHENEATTPHPFSVDWATVGVNGYIDGQGTQAASDGQGTQAASDGQGTQAASALVQTDDETKPNQKGYEITVATWNILAMAKSRNTPTGMIGFEAADEPTFQADKIMFLLKDDWWRGIDLFGLQEVDEIEGETKHLFAHLKARNFEIVQGPAYRSSDGLLDYSYLLYSKGKFKSHDCAQTYAEAHYMLCVMTFSDELGGKKLKIATGHSASTGLMPPEYKDSKGKTQTDKDGKAIAAFKPAILFGDFNTNTAKVKAAFPQFVNVHPARGEESFRRTQYIYRKLHQGVDNTDNWAAWPANIPKTCKGFMDNYQTFQEMTGKAEQQLFKYGNRWCGKKGKSWWELQKVFVNDGGWGSGTESYDNFVLDRIATEKLWCTDLPKCETIDKKHLNLEETEEISSGQEDGIVAIAEVTLSNHDIVGPGIGEEDLVHITQYPNTQWMSDHWIVQATVTIPEDIVRVRDNKVSSGPVSPSRPDDQFQRTRFDRVAQTRSGGANARPDRVALATGFLLLLMTA